MTPLRACSQPAVWVPHFTQTCCSILNLPSASSCFQLLFPADVSPDQKNVKRTITSSNTCTCFSVTPTIADRSEFPSVFFQFFYFSFFRFLFSCFFFHSPRGPPQATPLPKTSLVSYQNLNFKARFWVRRRRKEERRKKKERADRNRSPSTIARTRTVFYSRAWKLPSLRRNTFHLIQQQPPEQVLGCPGSQFRCNPHQLLELRQARSSLHDM